MNSFLINLVRRGASNAPRARHLTGASGTMGPEVPKVEEFDDARPPAAPEYRPSPPANGEDWVTDIVRPASPKRPQKPLQEGPTVPETPERPKAPHASNSKEPGPLRRVPAPVTERETQTLAPASESPVPSRTEMVASAEPRDSAARGPVDASKTGPAFVSPAPSHWEGVFERRVVIAPPRDEPADADTGQVRNAGTRQAVARPPLPAMAHAPEQRQEGFDRDTRSRTREGDEVAVRDRVLDRLETLAGRLERQVSRETPSLLPRPRRKPRPRAQGFAGIAAARRHSARRWY